MTVLAHHAGEDSLAQALVLLGGGGLWPTATMARLTRLLRPRR